MIPKSIVPRHSRTVREHVSQRQSRRGGWVFQRKARQVADHRRVKAHLTLVDQQRCPEAGEGFRHRCDREDRVLRHRLPGGGVSRPVSLGKHNLAVFDDRDSNAGNIPLAKRFGDKTVKIGEGSGCLLTGSCWGHLA